jgi:hypothetical protein
MHTWETKWHHTQCRHGWENTPSHQSIFLHKLYESRLIGVKEMRVNELIAILKAMPQGLEVFIPSEDSDYDYMPLRSDNVKVIESVLVDEDAEEDVKDVICALGGF